LIYDVLTINLYLELYKDARDHLKQAQVTSDLEITPSSSRITSRTSRRRKLAFPSPPGVTEEPISLSTNNFGDAGGTSTNEDLFSTEMNGDGFHNNNDDLPNYLVTDNGIMLGNIVVLQSTETQTEPCDHSNGENVS